MEDKVYLITEIAPSEVIAQVFPGKGIANNIAHACNFHQRENEMLHNMMLSGSNVLEQLMKGKWVDQEGHDVMLNKHVQLFAAALSMCSTLCKEISAAA